MIIKIFMVFWIGGWVLLTYGPLQTLPGNVALMATSVGRLYNSGQRRPLGFEKILSSSGVKTNLGIEQNILSLVDLRKSMLFD
ncbi:MAG: hypothetical protein TQ37_07670 [Candidatus Synechococcus spongiarum 15L]|uniref:Uncharacterized protein n=1 Tax=Candidatus Synechococcus spongiarum 15L TaxID=1608419 RepID=A0A0G8AU49_9SYNE|nr:MAG: hypothetical protein TQ37_07670 [Candidatus Synechococcus spongiarum 15L]